MPKLHPAFSQRRPQHRLANFVPSNLFLQVSNPLSDAVYVLSGGILVGRVQALT